MFMLARSTAGRWPRSARVLSGIVGELPSNLFQTPKRSKLWPAPRLRRGVYFIRQVRRCREPGDRSAADWRTAANSRDRRADFARLEAAPTAPGVRGCAE